MLNQERFLLSKLQSIFPQHSYDTILFIFEDVLKLYGNEALEYEEIILESCTERLLEIAVANDVHQLPGPSGASEHTTFANYVESTINGGHDRAVDTNVAVENLEENVKNNVTGKIVSPEIEVNIANLRPGSVDDERKRDHLKNNNKNINTTVASTEISDGNNVAADIVDNHSNTVTHAALQAPNISSNVEILGNGTDDRTEIANNTQQLLQGASSAEVPSITSQLSSTTKPKATPDCVNTNTEQLLERPFVIEGAQKDFANNRGKQKAGLPSTYLNNKGSNTMKENIAPRHLNYNLYSSDSEEDEESQTKIGQNSSNNDSDKRIDSDPDESPDNSEYRNKSLFGYRDPLDEDEQSVSSTVSTDSDSRTKKSLTTEVRKFTKRVEVHVESICEKSSDVNIEPEEQNIKSKNTNEPNRVHRNYSSEDENSSDNVLLLSNISTPVDKIPVYDKDDIIITDVRNMNDVIPGRLPQPRLINDKHANSATCYKNNNPSCKFESADNQQPTSSRHAVEAMPTPSKNTMNGLPHQISDEDIVMATDGIMQTPLRHLDYVKSRFKENSHTKTLSQVNNIFILDNHSNLHINNSFQQAGPDIATDPYSTPAFGRPSKNVKRKMVDQSHTWPKKKRMNKGESGVTPDRRSRYESSSTITSLTQAKKKKDNNNETNSHQSTTYGNNKQKVQNLKEQQNRQKQHEIDVLKLTKGTKGFFEHVQKRVKSVIEDVSLHYLDRLIQSLPDGMTVENAVQTIVMQLLDNRGYPKDSRNTLTTSSSKIETTPTKSPYYIEAALKALQRRFTRISTKVLKKLLMESRSYTNVYKILKELLSKINNGEVRVEDTIIGTFMRGQRNSTTNGTPQDEYLQHELNILKKEELLRAVEADHERAVEYNNQQYINEGQAIECMCCYVESSFDDMVQCPEGHLFCTTCLQRLCNEAVSGTGKSRLSCMAPNCEAVFLNSQLQKAVDEKTLKRLSEREQDEALKLANIENLFKCPHCDFAADVGEDPQQKVFSCQNQECQKQTCIRCQEPWNEDHIGIPCEQVEKKIVTNLRTRYEEKMTEAKVRKCWKCQTIFLKSDGCNKMTCRCGAKMCYICRKPEIDYSHFCQHPRDPGQSCNRCKKCSLWTNPEEDDDRAVSELQKEAEMEQQKLMDEGSSISSTEQPQRLVGPHVNVPKTTLYAIGLSAIPDMDIDGVIHIMNQQHAENLGQINQQHRLMHHNNRDQIPVRIGRANNRGSHNGWVTHVNN